MHQLLKTTEYTINHPHEFNKSYSNGIDRDYEQKVDEILNELKIKIMARFNTLKTRREDKLRAQFTQHHKSCLEVCLFSKFKIKICIITESEHKKQGEK